MQFRTTFLKSCSRSSKGRFYNVAFKSSILLPLNIPMGVDSGTSLKLTVLRDSDEAALGLQQITQAEQVGEGELVFVVLPTQQV